jgi:hypothetical protein
MTEAPPTVAEKLPVFLAFRRLDLCDEGRFPEGQETEKEDIARLKGE